MHEELPDPRCAATPRPLRRRTGIVPAVLAPAIAKLVDHALHHRKVDGKRCGDTIVRALERAGDPNGAAVVRAAMGDPPGLHGTPLGGRPQAQAVEWIDPTELSAEFVRDDACGRAVESLATDLESASLYLAHGIDAPTRIFFHGPSGVGKTLAARWLGGRLGLPVALVRLDSVVDSLMGETAKRLRACFDAAASCPSIVFLDEIDGMCARRDGTEHDVAEMRRVSSSLLQQLDLLPPGQIVIAASNFREKIDPALVRRLSVEILFSPPSLGARTVMLSRWWAGVEVTADALEAVLAGSEGMSGAALRAWAMGAARSALREGVPIAQRHVATAKEVADG